MEQKPPKNIFAIVGFILSIVGLDIISIPLCILGLKEAKITNQGRKLAKAGLIITIVKVVLVIVIGLLFNLVIWPQIKRNMIKSVEAALEEETEIVETSTTTRRPGTIIITPGTTTQNINDNTILCEYVTECTICKNGICECYNNSGSVAPRLVYCPMNSKLPIKKGEIGRVANCNDVYLPTVEGQYFSDAVFNQCSMTIVDYQTKTGTLRDYNEVFEYRNDAPSNDSSIYFLRDGLKIKKDRTVEIDGVVQNYKFSEFIVVNDIEGFIDSNKKIHLYTLDETISRRVWMEAPQKISRIQINTPNTQLIIYEDKSSQTIGRIIDLTKVTD